MRRLMKQAPWRSPVRVVAATLLSWENLPRAGNLVDRDLQAAAPNEKWLTDITEFHILAGKIYLSPMIGWSSAGP